jgi:branched-chain amino acid transport system ATP-binding protein
VEGVCAKYGDFLAVAGASFEVPAQSIVSVIGANGAGKSTLMDCIAGVHKPVSGRILFKGEDITGLSPNGVVAKRLALVPQGSRCFTRMTVEHNLLMGAYPKHARAGRGERLEKVYELFPMLREKRKDLSGSLSGGQRQMVAIGRALMSAPELILFDEISLGLAPTVIKDIYQRIRAINREGVSVVLVEQDVARSKKTSAYSYIMLRGEMVLSGPSKELDDEKVKNAYFGVR